MKMQQIYGMSGLVCSLWVNTPIFAQSILQLMPELQNSAPQEHRVTPPLRSFEDNLVEPVVSAADLAQPEFTLETTDKIVGAPIVVPENLSEPSRKPAVLTKTAFYTDHAEPSLWRSGALMVGFFASLGAAGFFMLRMRRRGFFKAQKAQNPLELISSLALTPKRQIILLNIRNKEIVIANTEFGVQFLTDAGSVTATERPLPPVQIAEKPSPKTDILMRALKKIEKSAARSEKPAPALASEAPQPLELDKMDAKSGTFPKYVSQMFDSESKRSLEQGPPEDNVENVTHLIREKLRSMKSLS